MCHSIVFSSAPSFLARSRSAAAAATYSGPAAIWSALGLRVLFRVLFRCLGVGSSSRCRALPTWSGVIAALDLAALGVGPGLAASPTIFARMPHLAVVWRWLCCLCGLRRLLGPRCRVRHACGVVVVVVVVVAGLVSVWVVPRACRRLPRWGWRRLWCCVRRALVAWAGAGGRWHAWLWLWRRRRQAGVAGVRRLHRAARQAGVASVVYVQCVLSAVLWCLLPPVRLRVSLSGWASSARMLRACRPCALARAASYLLVQLKLHPSPRLV